MAKILIIDDEWPIRAALRRVLEGAGHEVVDAPNGEEGMRLYREHPADLVVTDILMPEKDGLEVVRELQRDFPQVTVIGISGVGRTGKLDYLSYAKTFGATRIFSRPFDLKEFLEAVEESLGWRGSGIGDGEKRGLRNTD